MIYFDFQTIFMFQSHLPVLPKHSKFYDSCVPLQKRKSISTENCLHTNKNEGFLKCAINYLISPGSRFVRREVII